MGDFLLDFVKLSIVEKECPVTEKETSKKTIYKIKDTMFLFWYRFVRPNYTNIQLGLGKIMYEKNVKSHLSDYMGYVFERICMEYLYQEQIFLRLPFIPEKKKPKAMLWLLV